MQIIILVLVAVVVVVAFGVLYARTRNVVDLSSQEGEEEPPVRDRPAGPAAETMDPDELGGHPST